MFSIIIRSIKQWIIGHDDSYIFLLVYVGLAVYLSIVVGLFWLALVVFLHFLLEMVRQFYFNTEFVGILLRSIWELKLDLALVLFAFLLEIYLGFIFGIVGLGASARAITQVGSRFAAWESTLKGLLLTLDDLVIILKGLLSKPKIQLQENSKLFNAGDSDSKNQLQLPSDFSKYGGWVEKWSFGTWFTMVFFLTVTGFIIFAPFITPYSYHEVTLIFLESFHPFPVKD